MKVKRRIVTNEVSVIVCTYNRKKDLSKCLLSLINQDVYSLLKYKIIVVDNNSSDGTKDEVNRIKNISYVPIIYVQEQRPGIANARNAGVKIANGNWILFFDDDQIASTDMLKLFLFSAKLVNADCIGGRIKLNLNEKILKTLHRGCRGLLGECDYGEYIRRLKGKEYPPDACVMRKKKVFDCVGYFDTLMTKGGQDQDFTRRAIAAGFEMWYTPKAIAYHMVPKHRLKKSYFKWSSYRHGQSFAYLDNKIKGTQKMILLGIARCAQALFITVPKLALARLRNNDVEVLWRKSLLWRAEGYIRMLLFLLAPYIFPQWSYFSKLEFRKERLYFKENTNL
jgi:glycosyltransferase involved in cell wall biosynthesis